MDSLLVVALVLLCVATLGVLVTAVRRDPPVDVEGWHRTLRALRQTTRPDERPVADDDLIEAPECNVRLLSDLEAASPQFAPPPDVSRRHESDESTQHHQPGEVSAPAGPVEAPDTSRPGGGTAEHEGASGEGTASAPEDRPEGSAEDSEPEPRPPRKGGTSMKRRRTRTKPPPGDRPRKSVESRYGN